MPLNASPSSLLTVSRIKFPPTGRAPVSIATLFDFGELIIDEKKSTADHTEYKPTRHELDNRDFDKIMDQTAMKYQIRNNRKLEIIREFRVRILMKNKAVKFLHIISLKVCNIEDKIVEFRWKPTVTKDINSDGSYNHIKERSYRNYGNIFEDLLDNPTDTVPPKPASSSDAIRTG